MKAKRVVKSKAKEPSKERKQKTISIPPLEKKYAMITITGLSPLLVHKMSAKSKKQMSDKDQKKAKAGREARDPHQEFLDSMYTFKKGKKTCYGVPISGIKNCAVSATKFIDGIFQTTALGAFHVLDETKSGLAEIQSKSGPQFDERMVRIGRPPNKIAQIRYRARFDDWKISFKVVLNPRAISVEQLANLFENAGFSIGLCEHRPEKKGQNGMFEVLKK